MSKQKSVFELAEEKAYNLGVYPSTSKSSLKNRFITLFRKGKEEGKKELTLNQLVCGYYNLFTEPLNENVLPKHRFVQRLRYWFNIYDTSYAKDREKIQNKNTEKPFLIKNYGRDTYELVE